MRRLPTLLLVTGLANVAIGLAMAGVPFGGDDTGQIPSSASALHCENGIAKALGRAVVCNGKCTVKEADGKLADDAAEDACESSCLEGLSAAVMKLQTKAAGACDCVDAGALFATIESDFDSRNNLVYCNAAGTPFGGDDTGFIPPDSVERGCEDQITKLVGRDAVCIERCHQKRASGALPDDGIEDVCEESGADSCLGRFRNHAQELQDRCAPCVDSLNLGLTVESVLDTRNGLVYCAP